MNFICKPCNVKYHDQNKYCDYVVITNGCYVCDMY
jgi:hypothetical protein